MVHNGGQVWALFPTVLVGAKLVLTGADIDEIFAAVADHRVTHAMSIGPIAPKILAHRNIPRDSLKTLRLFGTMNRAAALEGALGVRCVSVAPPDASPVLRHETNGLPASARNELRLVRPGTDEEVGQGEVGELCFRGPASLVAYFGDEEATKAALSGDGFFRTGDLFETVTRDGERYLVFRGRAKDNIDRGGEKFGVDDIETLIGLHPSVADGRVVAMPDAIMGEKACAFLVLRPEATAPDVRTLGAFLLSHGLAKFKLPERIELIEQQPVTSVGKLDRVALRRLIAEKVATEPSSGSHAAPADNLR
jgi:non-ribosomal peptide synthetase component E (peptide arylation enzyme)